MAKNRKSGIGSPTNIEVDKTTLGRILKSRRLVVPGFQGEYSWQLHRVAKLFSDFQSAMTKGQDSYFLGTIVFQGTNPPSVIDGQQRLATTCIFLAAVRDAYLKLGATEEAKSITDDFLFTYDRDVKESLPRLLLNIDDREYIKNSVLVAPADRHQMPDRKEVHSHRLIDKAFACSHDRVKKITAGAMNDARKIEELNAWVDFIEHKAVVVALTPPSLSQAYQMFITMNDRAQRTTQADVIKSHLFQEVSDGETEGPHISEACAKWATARKQTDIGVPSQDDPILSYLRYLCVIRTGPVTIDGLFDVVEGGIRGRSKALQFLDAMSAYAKPYRVAIGDHPQFWDDKGHQLSKLVDHCVKNMGVLFPIPLFLAIGIKFSDKEAKVAMRAIESWCARLVITAAQRSGNCSGFGLLAHRIHKGEIKTAEHLIREAEATIVPSDNSFQEKFRAKTLSSKKQARFFLLELEAQIRADDGDAFAVAVDEPDRLNLEHVLPKSKEWASRYKRFTPDERDACVSKIGNLALIRKAANGAMSDAPFAEKLPVLAGSSLKTTVAIADFAKDEGDWTPLAIDKRQVWLSDLALKRWPLFADKKGPRKK